MAVQTEGRHAGEHIIREFDPEYNRETANVASGQNLKAGQVVMISATKLVAMSGDLDTDGVLENTAAGILFEAVDASSSGPLGATDRPGVYHARGPMVVKRSALTFPAETTDGDEEAKVIAQLETLGIVVR